jgi:hypothetical protein
MALGQLFGSLVFAPQFLFWYPAFFGFIVPAMTFSVVVLLHVQRRMFKTIDVVVVLLVLATLTASVAKSVIRVLL